MNYPDTPPIQPDPLLVRALTAERKLAEARTALEELIESPSPDEPEGDFGRGTTPRKRARQALARIDGNVPDQPR